VLLYQVKKGLEHLYRKVEKHLCEEENLLQVLYFVALVFSFTCIDKFAKMWSLSMDLDSRTVITARLHFHFRQQICCKHAISLYM